MKKLLIGLLMAFFSKTNTTIPAVREPIRSTYDTYSVAHLFLSPVHRDITLSGTFGELRPNHFHAGLDIKSLNGQVGEPIFAAARGFVARIKISAYGYGRALYLQHPNGHTTVYAHLDRFIPEIDDYIKKEHYRRQRFEMDMSLSPNTFPIKEGQHIAYMGNSGSSTGPHLHFEIRNSMTEEVLNPLGFGLKLKDGTAPSIYSLKLIGRSAFNPVSLMTLQVKESKERTYSLDKDTLVINNEQIGLAIKTYDRATGSSSHLGIYSIRLFEDDALKYQFDMNTVSFDEMRYSNAHRDYEEQYKRRQVFHRLFRLSGNKLPIYSHSLNDGWIFVPTNEVKKIKIEVLDYHRNASQLEFYLKQAAGPPPAVPVSMKHASYDQPYTLEMDQLKLYMPANRLYTDTYLDIQHLPPIRAWSPYIKVHDPVTPLHRSIKIGLRPDALPAALKSKAIITLVNGGVSNQGGKWNGEWLETNVTSFGNYTVDVDTVAPVIKPINFKTDMKKNSNMRFKISDNFGVGGEAEELVYNAWIDGNWILMELDSKSDVIQHEFDERTRPGKHNLRLQVKDDRGNSKTFVQTFVK